LIPTSLAEVLTALTDEPSAMVLAGGTDAMVEINAGHRRPSAVIAIGRVSELRTWTHDVTTASLRIGAGVTYAELESSHFRQWAPALSQAARTVGSPQIRHAATLGGNVATWRRSSGSRRPRRHYPPHIDRRHAFSVIRRVHDRPEAHDVATG
jgi:CO/xanthine dehydrogenase FAD-binding subunit